jgi:hypothetical protein
MPSIGPGNTAGIVLSPVNNIWLFMGIEKYQLLLAFWTITRRASADNHTFNNAAAARTRLTSFAINLELLHKLTLGAIQMLIVGNGSAAGADSFS